MEALVKGMTFLLRPWYSAWQGTGALRACYSLRECFALCLGLFCSAIPCPAIPQSGIFSHCYHFSPLWLWHFLPLTLSFLFWLSLDLQFVLSATSLFSFFKEKKKIFIVLYAVFPLVVSALELAVWMAECSLAWLSEPYRDPVGWQVEPATPLLLK